MLKIFRRIRQDMLKNKKSTAYLLYALGEILLVMVGILLALQVNNWNEDRQVKKNLNNYVIQLNEEIKANIEILNTVIEGETRYARDIDTIVLLFDNNDLENRKLYEKSGSLLSFEEFLPVTTTFENLKASGDLKLINDIALRNAIFSAYNSFETVKLIQELHYYNMKTRAVDYFYNNASFGDITQSKPNFAKDILFENLALSAASTIQQKIEACKSSLDQMQELEKKLLTFQSEQL